MTPCGAETRALVTAAPATRGPPARPLRGAQPDLVARAAHDGREHGPRGVVAREAGFHQARAVVAHEGGGLVFVAHGAWFLQRQRGRGGDGASVQEAPRDRRTARVKPGDGRRDGVQLPSPGPRAAPSRAERRGGVGTTQNFSTPGAQGHRVPGDRCAFAAPPAAGQVPAPTLPSPGGPAMPTRPAGARAEGAVGRAVRHRPRRGGSFRGPTTFQSTTRAPFPRMEDGPSLPLGSGARGWEAVALGATKKKPLCPWAHAKCQVEQPEEGRVWRRSQRPVVWWPRVFKGSLAPGTRAQGADLGLVKWVGGALVPLSPSGSCPTWAGGYTCRSPAWALVATGGTQGSSGRCPLRWPTAPRSGFIGPAGAASPAAPQECRSPSRAIFGCWALETPPPAGSRPGPRPGSPTLTKEGAAWPRPR